MPELPRKGGSIHWDVSGKGEPIVMLRGLGRTVRHWLGYDQELAQHFRVLTLDLRGVGKTTAAHGWTDSIYTLADDVADAMTAAGMEQAHILGVSLGGMVTLAMGLRHPDRCLSIITVNTSIAGQRTLRMSVPGIAGIVRGMAAGGDVIHRNLAHAMVGSGPDAAEIGRIAGKYAEIARDGGMHIETIFRQLAAAARFHVKKKLKKCELPALIVYGTADRFVPNINSRKLAKLLPRARLVAVDGGGHELTLDRGPELTKIVVDWVAERAKAAR